MIRERVGRNSRAVPRSPAEADGKVKDRHSAIIAALRHLMQTQGYAETKLTDLAKAAGLSVSHLLYYFPSKEAVLEELCTEIIDRHFKTITANINESPEERIHVMVDNIFVQSALPENERGLALELTALALHRPRLRKKLENNNRRMMAYLRDLYSKVPRQPGLEVDDAAELAAAVWMGLVSNALYDKNLDEPRARRLLRRSMLSIAGIANTHTHVALSRPDS